MLKLLFILTLILFIGQWIHIIIVIKDYFNISTFIIIGIYLPMMLFFMNWSGLIEKGISEDFYLIFFYLNTFTLFFNFFIRKGINSNNINIEIKSNHMPVTIINIIFLLACFIENYIGSGSFLPAIHEIDIHTFRASIFVYFTSSIYLVLLVNYLFWIKIRKIRYIFWMIGILLVPIIGKSSRMDVTVAAFGVVCFAIWERINEDRINFDFKNKSKLKKYFRNIIFVLIVGIAINYIVSYGNYRMNHYGRYNISYADGILYTGPKFLKNIVSVYYGYFPFSFNNLNINIKYTAIDISPFGTNSFRGIYQGILQLDNIIGLPINTANAAKMTVTSAATVMTGFWDFYYDYGITCFIPIVVSLFIYLILKKKVIRRNATIANYAIYFYWIPLWFFMSFNNTAFDVCVFTNMILIYIVTNYYFKIEHRPIAADSNFNKSAKYNR